MQKTAFGKSLNCQNTQKLKETKVLAPETTLNFKKKYKNKTHTHGLFVCVCVFGFNKSDNYLSP